MKDPVNRFLTEKELRFIEERIREAEKITSGEIVVKIVSSSDTYAAAGLLASSIISLPGAILIMIALQSRDMWMFLGIFAALFMVLNELFTRVPTLKRPFVSASDRQREVEEGALGAFFRRGINDTIDHTGILLYISLFEHKVRVVADKGISETVDQEVWQAIVDIIISGIHEKRQGTAVAAAVDRCGQILARHFPVKPGDRNELADTIIMGRVIR